ncbi:MAG: 1-acyl-sn-glycerol-3-phosphate acyltransferase, partial [Raoultibacter sp.]
NLIFGFLGILFKICFRYRVDGRENVRNLQGVCGGVVVGNHTSFLDVVMFYLAVRPSQWIRFMGRDSLFEAGKGFVGPVLTRVGAFPVKRGSADQRERVAARVLRFLRCTVALHLWLAWARRLSFLHQFAMLKR